jgi:hypothetical protein
LVAGNGDLGGRLPALGGADRQQGAPVGRGVRCDGPAGQHVIEPGVDARIGIEAQDRVGLRQRIGQLVAVALGQATDRNHLLAAVGRRQQGVDRVLLRRVDEATGVDHHDVGAVGLGQLPAASSQGAGEFLGINLVAGTAEGEDGDAVGLHSGERLGHIVQATRGHRAHRARGGS